MIRPYTFTTSATNCRTKTKVTTPKLEYTEDVQSKQKQHVEILNLKSARISEAIKVKKVMMTQTVEYMNDPESPINLAMLENEIYEAT